MAGLGATPRTKEPSREHRGLSTPRAAARGRARSRQREGERVPRGWARVPGSPSTPGTGRLVRQGPGECPGPGESDPASPPPLPCPGGSYFSGLPEAEHQESAVPAAPSLPSPGALTPARDGPRRIRSRSQHTLVLELVHVKLRPHVQEFLESLSKTYEIFVYTTAKRDYAKKLLEVLDPKKKLIRRCFSQSDCVCSRGCYWKDLTCLGRDLAKTVALDHATQGFPAQAANWIPVPPWCGDPQDEELLRLIPVLGRLGQAEDVRPEIQRQFRQPPAED
ncbi:CTD small phosphatase-like protein 2-A isoform X2 [Hirundo rustica]|uniref:CTD small phosphatase-like protein 2-A isoform X2 n=1 Tax=Hirundo rustica TaxID=43150 RepID=UPI001A953673|nr:CTD small phosphatase-like protein 2-A isoform X2 [Hirundo rustica]